MDMKNPDHEYRAGAAGFAKMFHVETMRRIPHKMEREVRDALTRTNYEGRLFPQALSDAFGQNPHVTAIELTIAKKMHHFAPSDNDEDDLLLIHVSDDRYERRKVYYINMDDLHQFHSSGWHAFQAGETATELARLYRLERG